MCDEEDLDLDDLLNRPGNRYRLKEKEVELEIEALRNLNEKLLSMKQDPHFHVEKSFERIFNQLELRRVEVKQTFETQINEYYDQLRKNLEYVDQKIFSELECGMLIQVRV